MAGWNTLNPNLLPINLATGDQKKLPLSSLEMIINGVIAVLNIINRATFYLVAETIINKDFL